MALVSVEIQMKSDEFGLIFRSWTALKSNLKYLGVFVRGSGQYFLNVGEG